MEFLAISSFSDNQKKIISLRAEGKTYQEVIQAMNTSTGLNTGPKHISTCLTRSALGYSWDYSQTGGALPYLCDADIWELSKSVKNAHEMGNPMDTMEVLDEATRLKGRRIAWGVQFLREINSIELSEKLGDQNVYTPCRSWINNILDDLEAHIRSRRLIEQKRLEACSFRVIETFYSTFGPLIQDVNTSLLFTADETMLQTSSRRKAVLPIGVKCVVEEGYPNLPHISAMMCTNILGIGPPPFIILNDLQHLPPELKCFADGGNAWFASSSNGYMTRDVFTMWTICFVNWLSKYKQSLPCDIRRGKALVILDGHTSRENPLALALFRKANVEVIVLPSHSTHVLQMFDVGLAGPLKSFYAAKVKKCVKKCTQDISLMTNAAKYRRACIEAFLDAWQCACTPSNCFAAARETGIYPLDPNAVKQSIFVRNLNAEEQRRYDLREQRNANRFTISMKNITNVQVIVQIVQEVNVGQRFKHLCDLERYFPMKYSDIVKEVIRMKYNGARMLSNIPPFYRYNAGPIFFDDV